MKEELKKYKVLFEVAAQWGDMDAAQHINNLVYLRWAESARIHYFEKIGIDISFVGKEIGPILGWQECKYIFPMTYPDTAVIGIRTVEIQSEKLIIECAIFSQKYQRIVAISRQSIVPYDYKALKKAALPDEWLESINSLE